MDLQDPWSGFLLKNKSLSSSSHSRTNERQSKSKASATKNTPSLKSEAFHVHSTSCFGILLFTSAQTDHLFSSTRWKEFVHCQLGNGGEVMQRI